MTHLTTLRGDPVSRFAFGTMQFGGTAGSSASAALFAVARDAGINHFDTAYIYTGGASETILGALAQADRDHLIIASKLAYDGTADPERLQRDFDTSRKRLGMDSVDILYLHRHPGADLLRALDWLATQQSAGTLRYIGVSNFAAWEVMHAQQLAQERGTRIDIVQPMYSLVKRQAEVEILPMCAHQGIACAPYSPLGGGLLTGKYTQGGAGRLTEDDRYAARYALPYAEQTARDLSALAKDIGVHPATLAAAWVAHHPAHPMPILSARSAEQLTPSLAAIGYPMDGALYDRIGALSPAPPPATDRTEERP